jgi:4'-phosphopantetheinyl transferase
VPRASEHVTVWQIPLERSVAELSARIALLAPNEVARAERYATPKLAADFVMVRSTLRGLLGAELGLAATDVRIEYGRAGKPAVGDDGRLRISIAHTRGLGVVALVRDRDVGIDVEYPEPIDVRDELPGLSAAEARGVRAAADPVAAFYRCWTLKEALAKASGAGIARSIPELVPEREEQRIGRYVARSLELRTAHHAALAVECGRTDRFPEVVLRTASIGGVGIEA